MFDVNFIKNSVAFARHIPIDDRLTPYHISMYYAYFHLWNDERFDNPFRMYRNDVMDLAAIGSTTTFRKCLNDLNRWEYLHYLPSQSKHRPSKIEMHRLDIANPKPFVLWEQQNVKRDSISLEYAGNHTRHHGRSCAFSIWRHTAFFLA
jgi:hypothetical protein